MMNEYNMFVNRYYMYFRTDLTFTEFVQIQEKVSSFIDHLVAYESMPIPDEKVFEFVMYTILSKYPTQQVLNNIHDLEIKNLIKYYSIKLQKDRNSNIQTNPSKKYIYNQLKEIKPVFQKGTNLKILTDRLYSQLKHLGYKDEDILEQNCDYTMIELLRGNGLGISFTDDFNNYKKKIEFRVSNLFTKRKLDIIRREGLNIGNDMAFQFYNSSYHQMNTAFKAALSFYMSGYELKEAKSDVLDDYIETFITKNMIQINSVTDLRINRFESTQVRTAEEKAFTEDEKKKRAAAIAIILSIFLLGSSLEGIIMKMPTEKEKSSHQKSENLFQKIYDNLLSYDYESNTFSFGGN